ncbi:hypothetical protein HL658_20075 [Azospirillum sp. RWY-5-1]|uniref:HEPN domain-containing protein n=1 Tax=Azospirillum oleiclasticum TaxID=2735135 RepID=A0ABX2TEE8_9PROT|nr:hypothetical protein [Azospirillum oleiclasticum]NYZ14849.1 hypothetical protein [Azospirillum oleiclasticum]NYZ22165.1 hypothetical protein [Azospirillum oleiclasticum]
MDASGRVVQEVGQWIIRPFGGGGGGDGYDELAEAGAEAGHVAANVQEVFRELRAEEKGRFDPDAERHEQDWRKAARACYRRALYICGDLRAEPRLHTLPQGLRDRVMPLLAGMTEVEAAGIKAGGMDAAAVYGRVDRRQRQQRSRPLLAVDNALEPRVGGLARCA